MQGVSRILARLSAAQLDLAALCTGLILVQVSADVLLRVVFNAPIPASNEVVAYYYMVGLTFLPLMAVELYDGHVTTDVFFQRFPLAVQKACILIGAALTLLLYLTLAWFSLDAALAATATGEVVMGAWSLPIWIVRWVLPIAFVTAAMGALASLVMQLRGTAGKGEPVPHE
ncbi:TRAP transporter small permease subunit [uncultured Maritimibacter sp.]|jgi:TRAP-type C4-dicarboxylate transport system permease small subunit|uniref:TRAP transporter small permease subunit n=1 Tax=uncultured Maritimibacter sp. TaxID=991866 RepID=UPI002622F4AC|nr:TRAP transporter small permease [uncultured Maritimibacter sp.]